MGLEKQIVVQVGLSGSTLRRWSERARVPCYDPSPAELRHRAWVDVVSNGAVSEITTMEELCSALRSGMRADFTGDEIEEIASVVSFLLGAGKVVVDHPMFGFLERQFDVVLANHPPRFENGQLKFLVVRVDLERPAPELENIELNLESARVTRTPVRARS